jgi:hypothetical protein
MYVSDPALAGRILVDVDRDRRPRSANSIAQGLGLPLRWMTRRMVLPSGRRCSSWCVEGGCAARTAPLRTATCIARFVRDVLGGDGRRRQGLGLSRFG